MTIIHDGWHAKSKLHSQFRNTHCHHVKIRTKEIGLRFDMIHTGAPSRKKNLIDGVYAYAKLQRLCFVMMAFLSDVFVAAIPKWHLWHSLCGSIRRGPCCHADCYSVR